VQLVRAAVQAKRLCPNGLVGKLARFLTFVAALKFSQSVELPLLELLEC
jgi:hypothetical protein